MLKDHASILQKAQVELINLITPRPCMEGFRKRGPLWLPTRIGPLKQLGYAPIRGHNFDNLPHKPHVRVHTWLFITWKIPVLQLSVLLLLLHELLFCCYQYYLSLILSLLLLILLKLLAQHGVDFQVSYHCKEPYGTCST